MGLPHSPPPRPTLSRSLSTFVAGCPFIFCTLHPHLNHAVNHDSFLKGVEAGDAATGPLTAGRAARQPTNSTNSTPHGCGPPPSHTWPTSRCRCSAAATRRQRRRGRLPPPPPSQVCGLSMLWIRSPASRLSFDQCFWGLGTRRLARRRAPADHLMLATLLPHTPPVCGNLSPCCLSRVHPPQGGLVLPVGWHHPGDAGAQEGQHVVDGGVGGAVAWWAARARGAVASRLQSCLVGWGGGQGRAMTMGRVRGGRTSACRGAGVVRLRC